MKLNIQSLIFYFSSSKADETHNKVSGEKNDRREEGDDKEKRTRYNHLDKQSKRKRDTNQKEET